MAEFSFASRSATITFTGATSQPNHYRNIVPMQMQRLLILLALIILSALPGRAGVITSLVESGGDGAPTAQFTGNTFTGPTIGTYTVPAFGVLAKAFCDRLHAYTNASGSLPMPPYLVGQEYIMIRNDNRDNNGGTNGGSANIYNLNVTISSGAQVYLLIDNRLGDGNAANPPSFGPTNMAWVTNEGWAPVTNGINRTASAASPDELGIDVDANGGINDFLSVYSKAFPAGSFVLKQANNPSRDMYGVVIVPAAPVVPPGPPTNLTAVNGDSVVNLNWVRGLGASGYKVHRSGTPGGPYSPIGGSATTNYSDTTVVNGSLYYYVVTATNSAGENPTNSNEAVGAPNVVVTGIIAVGGTNEVSLSWSLLPGADTYSVLRADAAGGPYTTVASALAGTSYLDIAVASGRTYYYRISAALTGGGTSGQSATVPATTAPVTPSISSFLFASTVIRVGWSSTNAVVAGHYLEGSTDGLTFSLLAALGGNVLSYTNSGLALGGTYYYRVYASNAAGISAYSAVASNATPAWGVNVNFQTGASNSAGNPVSPTPVGYLSDIGDLFGDRTNGWFYGWTNLAGTNIVRDARYRQNTSSPDLRYDTFNHMQKSAGNPAWWYIQIPNGFYRVRVVGGDVTAVDSTFQYNINGVLTPAYVPVAGAWWADFATNVSVSDGTLGIAVGPSMANGKICFVDIYPDIPVPPVIGTQPQSQTNIEYRVTSLSVGLSQGSPTLYYQWYFNDSPLDGATNSTLTFNRLRMTNDGSYYVVITNYGGAVTSSVATMTVLPDGTGPRLVSVGSVDGNVIGVCFDEEVNVADGAATEVLSYTIDDGSMVQVNSVSFRSDNRTARLVLSGPVTGPFSVTVVSIPDIAGNYADSATNGTIMGLAVGDVGNPLFAGTNFTCDSQTVELVASGADIWGVGDQGHFATRTVTGDFDARVRVTALAGLNAITKADIIARENLSSNAVSVHVSVNPQPPGRNLAQMGLRPTTGAGTLNIGTNFTPTTIPNEWLRLVRAGTTLTGYRSGDGTNWTQLGQTNATLAAALDVGIALTSHDNNVLATGSFSGLTISQLYAVTASAGANGAISPAGYISLQPGASQTFTATPSGGYVVDMWTLDGNTAQTGGTTFSVNNIQTNHTLNVTFRSDNTAPVLASISNRVVHAGALVIVALAGSDTDVPANILTYGLPARDNTNAAVDASGGYFIWQTDALDAGTTNNFTASVTDNGTPGLSDTKSFTITVLAPPRFRSISTLGLTNFMVVENAIDLGLYNFQFKSNLNDVVLIEGVSEAAAAGDTALLIDDTAPPTGQRFYLLAGVNALEVKAGGSVFCPTGPGTTVTYAQSTLPGVVTTSGLGSGGFTLNGVVPGNAVVHVELAGGRKRSFFVTCR